MEGPVNGGFYCTSESRSFVRSRLRNGLISRPEIP